MVKRKRGQMPAISTKADKTLGVLCDEDDWVFVKKQKITILIPPSALRKHSVPQVFGTDQVSTKSRRTRKQQSQTLNEIHPRTGSGGERPLAAAFNLTKRRSKSNVKTAPEGPNHLVGESRLPSLHVIHKPLIVSGCPKASRRPIVTQSTCHKGPMLLIRPIACLNVSIMQNRMMRASNLERKLEMVGGLRNWLMSLGLGQFVKMFHSKNVDKFQLLSLTMEKLKDMGAIAVGPRRKLMHAINCLSQPHCFSTF
ncbi:Sterile alpha motif (SAM) domain-containing protein [Thalictrum thalictroides]|uniref:Sterile alpha motif (SAM) domain-containing protein n=1 Tax=Thalictrum thalictroides TaxID=46969 RepID=A0A7J6UYH0_THATH|nr:Sterile alpha motif (SAM) domain-containing protein [Thalictrum thalictroides]